MVGMNLAGETSVGMWLANCSSCSSAAAAASVAGILMFSSGVSSWSLPNLNQYGAALLLPLLPVQWSPTASVHLFFVIDSEAQFDWCWSFNCKSSVVRKFSSNSPLERSEVEVHCNEGIVVRLVVAGCIVSPAVFFVKPLGFFDVSFRDVLLPPT
jgi:hypothetical protein